MFLFLCIFIYSRINLDIYLIIKAFISTFLSLLFQLLGHLFIIVEALALHTP